MATAKKATATCAITARAGKPEVITPQSLEQAVAAQIAADPINQITLQSMEQAESMQIAWMRVFKAMVVLGLDPKVQKWPPAAQFVKIMTRVVSNAMLAENVTQALEPLDNVLPKGAHGATFLNGRKVGTVNPLTLAIRRILGRNPHASAQEVWDALKARPPKGVALFDSPRLGRYVETDGHRDTGYRRFCNLVSQERPK